MLAVPLIGVLLIDRAAAAEDATGATTYKARCASCHGETGKADTALARALKVEPLVADPRLAGMTVGQIAEAVRANPKHRGIADLTDADIYDGAIFVRTLAAGR